MFGFLQEPQSKISSDIWCGRGDLNPHASRRHPLKMVCLPISPLPHCRTALLRGTHYISIVSWLPICCKTKIESIINGQDPQGAMFSLVGNKGISHIVFEE